MLARRRSASRRVKAHKPDSGVGRVLLTGDARLKRLLGFSGRCSIDLTLVTALFVLYWPSSQLAPIRGKKHRRKPVLFIKAWCSESGIALRM